MLEANLSIIKELKEFITIVQQQPELLSKFSAFKNSFTRTRKLPFGRLVLLIAKLCKKTLSVELDKFYEELSSPITCSVSAFSQQRMKLKPIFFQVWIQLLVDSYYHYYGDVVKRWKGYRIIAADGSSVSLVNTPPLNAHFGGQSNQWSHFIQAKVFYCYDVLNEIIMFPQIKPYRYGELNMAYDNINELQSDMLVIYDRNFCNYKMVALHLWQEKEIKFIIRAKETQIMIRNFIATGEMSKIVEMKPTTEAIEELRKCGYKINKNTLLKVRLVRVELGKLVEVLITNLWEEEGHTTMEFKELYFKRWGIETNIGLQKNILRLESFSGLTVQSVEQDFYATVFAANLHSIVIKQAQDDMNQKQTKWKYPMKVNKNKSHGKLRDYMVALFTTRQPDEVLRQLDEYFIRHPIPVRKGRSFARVVKNKQSKSKHKTFMNYKPAF